MATLFSTATVSRIVLSCCNFVRSSSHKYWYFAVLTRKFPFHSRSSHAEITCVIAWLLVFVQTVRYCTELIISRSIARAVTAALHSASWLARKAAARLLLAKMFLFLLLIRICCRCLSHTIDNSSKQRNNVITTVAALLSHSAYQCLFTYFTPSCDVINHKNATAHVNVTGSIRVQYGFEPGCGARVKGGLEA